MKLRFILLVSTTLIMIKTHAQTSIIGGPCQGCEYIFHDMPKELSAHGKMVAIDEPGEKLFFSGTVYSLENEPKAGIIIYAYQTDLTGAYPKGTTPHGKIRGWAKTDTQGQYSFETIRPAAYPGGTEPQHIHMHVLEENKGTYYIDDITFTDDPLLSRLNKKTHCRGGCGKGKPSKDKQGQWHIKRDIILGLNIKAYQ